MELNKVKEIADAIKNNIGRVIVGKEQVSDLIITSLLAGGHVLIEDNPGTGKTTLTKAMAKSISGEFKRVQFTPDLMPSDITGLNIFNQQRAAFELVKGPVFTNILLGDEINRATPRTQSSLLEAMEERQVTIDKETLELPEPFIVLATENPIETTGTYPLPEAQLDRFIMKIDMGETDREEELEIIERYIASNPLLDIKQVCTLEDIASMKEAVKNVFVHSCIREYIVDIVQATRTSSKVMSGASVRGTLALVRCCQAYSAIKGKKYVEPDCVKMLAPYVLGHRLVGFGHGNGSQCRDIIKGIVDKIEVPVENWEN